MNARIRLLPFAIADGPTNMAADEALLLSAAEGVASLRFYGWSPATLSLGYFQPATVRLSDPRLAKLPWVRRASGGATLVHDRELTYALALPSGLLSQSEQSWMPRFHEIIAAALARLGLDDGIGVVAADEVRGDVLCFQKLTVGDLVCQGHKIGGSAQRKHRRALLQHGSILLHQSDWTPELPGIFELTGLELPIALLEEEILRQFSTKTLWTVDTDDWRPSDRQLIDQLIHDKYDHVSWRNRR